jgi:N,N'-diacetyllegionaminate synthase
MISYAAICKGANLIEKTITLNKYTKSVEHIMSLEPPQMIEFVKNIRNLEKTFGSVETKINKDFYAKRKKVRKSVVASKDIAIGDEINYQNVNFKAPENGISLKNFYFLKSQKKIFSRKLITKGSFIKSQDIKYS